MIPTLYWSQDRSGFLRISFRIDGGKDLSYQVTEQKLTFSAKNNEDKQYDVVLDLFDKVETEGHKSHVYGREIVIELKRAGESTTFWKRLLADAKTPSYVKVDFSRIEDEDSDEEEFGGNPFGGGFPGGFPDGMDEDDSDEDDVDMNIDEEEEESENMTKKQKTKKLKMLNKYRFEHYKN